MGGFDEALDQCISAIVAAALLIARVLVLFIPFIVACVLDIFTLWSCLLGSRMFALMIVGVFPEVEDLQSSSTLTTEGSLGMTGNMADYKIWDGTLFFNIVNLLLVDFIFVLAMFTLPLTVLLDVLTFNSIKISTSWARVLVGFVRRARDYFDEVSHTQREYWTDHLWSVQDDLTKLLIILLLLAVNFAIFMVPLEVTDTTFLFHARPPPPTPQPTFFPTVSPVPTPPPVPTTSPTTSPSLPPICAPTIITPTGSVTASDTCVGSGCGSTFLLCGLDDNLNYNLEISARGDYGSVAETITVQVNGGTPTTSPVFQNECVGIVPILNTPATSTQGRVTIQYTQSPAVDPAICPSVNSAVVVATATEVP